MAELLEPVHHFEGVGRRGLNDPFWYQQVSVVGTNLSSMTVMGFNGTDWVILNPAAGDGSENAAGVLLRAVDSATAVQQLVGRQYFEVSADMLVWPGGITGPQKTAAIAQLEALNIRVRGMDVG